MRTRERHLFFLQKTRFPSGPHRRQRFVVYILKKSFVLHKNLARGSKTYRDFIASWAASRPENLVPLALKFVTRVRGQLFQV